MIVNAFSNQPGNGNMIYTKLKNGLLRKKIRKSTPVFAPNVKKPLRKDITIMHLFMMKLDIGMSANAALYMKKPMELTT